MKKITMICLSALMVFGLSACGSQNNAATLSATEGIAESTTTTESTAAIESTTIIESTTAIESAATIENTTKSMAAESMTTEEISETTKSKEAEGKTLVVYYSATGNTEEAANNIAAVTNADLFELEPVEPYSREDLNWRDANSRVVYEHDNLDARVVELTTSTVSDWASYDTVFIGYPIWWGIAAWPVDGFIAANDFTGKTVIPFCTSSSSGLGESGELLAEAAQTGNWLEGRRFSSNVSKEEVSDWIESLGLQNAADESISEN